MTTISDILDHKSNREVATIMLTAKAIEGAAALAQQQIGVLVCCDKNNTLAGVFSERDVVRAFAERPHEVPNLLVSDLATRDVITCAPEDNLKEVIRQMSQGGFRHLPVVSGGILKGLISVTDIFRYLNDNSAPHERMEIYAAYATMSLPV